MSTIKRVIPRRSLLALFVLALFAVPTYAQAEEWHIQDNTTGGDCSSIGNWDVPTKTCTLTQDSSQGIIIDNGSNITLDGNEHTISGANLVGNGVYLIGSTGITIKNLNIHGFEFGIYLNGAINSTLADNTANSNNFGIYLSEASDNTLTDNTASNNISGGIFLADGSGNNTLTGNVTSNNGSTGISINLSNNNALTGNTASSNDFVGISLVFSSNNTLVDNIAQENGNSERGDSFDKYDIKVMASSDSHCDNSIASTTSSGGRPVKYFSGAVNLNNETLSELILCNADNSNISDITIDASATRQNNGLLLVRTDSSTITNVKSSNNYIGINLDFSNNNTLTDNTASNNIFAGFYLHSFSSGNTLTGNTASNNFNFGIYIGSPSTTNNQIYRNNLVNNSPQVFVSPNSTNNVFSLPLPHGGNYWSDYDTPSEGCNNSNGDNFCDDSLVYETNATPAVDNFPWVFQDGWLAEQETTTLTVTKVVVNDDGGTKQVADFPLFVTKDGVATAVESGIANEVSAGTYTVSETNASGYSALFSNDCDASGSVTILPGDHKTCIITNDDIATDGFPPIFTLLTQSKTSGDEIGEGASIVDSAVAFRAVIRGDSDEFVRFQVELRRMDESFTSVEDGGILTSEPVTSGEVAEIIRSGLDGGLYHWRARTIDSGNFESTWSEFGAVGNIDFEVMPYYTVDVEGERYRVYYQLVRNGAHGERTPVFSARRFFSEGDVPVTSPALGARIAKTAYVYEKITSPSFEDSIERSYNGANTMIINYLGVQTVEAVDECKIRIVTSFFVGPAPLWNCLKSLFIDTGVFDSLSGENMLRVTALVFTEVLKENYNTILVLASPILHSDATLNDADANRIFDLMHKGTFEIQPLSTDLLFRIGEMDTTISEELWNMLSRAMGELIEVAGDNASQISQEVASRFVPIDQAEETFIDVLGYIATLNHAKDYVESFQRYANVLASVFEFASAIETYSHRYLLDLSLEAAIDDWGVRTVLGEDARYQRAKILSPGELRAYDSQGRVTGLVDGVVKQDIPNSLYSNGRVLLFNSQEQYVFVIAGVQEGKYGLVAYDVAEETIEQFVANLIPISPSETHTFQIDWPSLSLGGAGVMLQVDSDSDGEPEQTLHLGKIFSGFDAKLLLENALEKLRSIDTGHESLDNATNAMEEDLSSLLADDAWLDRNTLSWPDGQQVLADEAKIVAVLSDVLSKIGTRGNVIVDPDTVTRYHDAQSLIVRSGALLARLALDEAQKIQAKDAIDQRFLSRVIGNIQNIFNRARNIESRSPVQALQLYGSVWTVSQTLLKTHEDLVE